MMPATREQMEPFKQTAQAAKHIEAAKNELHQAQLILAAMPSFPIARELSAATAQALARFPSVSEPIQKAFDDALNGEQGI